MSNNRPNIQHIQEDRVLYIIYLISIESIVYTLPETNIAPARKLPQKETNLPTIHFQVLC